MADEAPVGRWLTVKQVANLAQRHPKTVLIALRRGELKGSQARANASWRVHSLDADAWIRAGAPSALAA